jgi:hypothetical protein
MTDSNVIVLPTAANYSIKRRKRRNRQAVKPTYHILLVAYMLKTGIRWNKPETDGSSNSL